MAESTSAASAPLPSSAGPSSSTKPRQAIWLRCEKKEHERRSALTPTTAKMLMDNGFDVYVERDNQRIFADKEFEAVGVKMVPNNEWPQAPLDVPIFGLKELEVSDEPLRHTHISFAHCYKQQAGWRDVLRRFRKGDGLLYDLEFLEDPETRRRVAAFGFYAGFAGAAAGALAYVRQKEQGGQGVLRDLQPYDNEQAMIEDVRKSINALGEGGVGNVKALVIGALGRCGSGAVDAFRKIGLKDENIVKWDMQETAKGGPFPELLDVDIFVNCIYLSKPIPKFITEEFIKQAGHNRKLSVVVDVSCDTTNPHNPIPIYPAVNTSFPEPTVEVNVGESNPRMTVIAIDHLPTLLPREASEQFSKDLIPTLLQLPERQTAKVWTNAEALFRQKMKEAEEEDARLGEAN
ncbi:hypothetical protein QFC21_003512 [Naganishia friedmannii]|uniref:Uncharacterized protein n=1 Tax=Naganishia friedmannii TaxID=89922 RepID=A0ACC2VN17_9TREE|nr:hypothetical protein QFC21_003512 [Naganishia friedmannii]